MEDIRIDGLTADEWEGLANPQAPTNEQLVELGILQEQPQQSTEAPNDTVQPQKAERDDYEDLGYWQTVGDELVAGAVELSKFVTPKKYELQYTPRTRAGEAFQTFSKYLYGIGGLLMGGEVAAVAKAGAAAKGMNGASKVAGGLETVLKGDKFFKTGKGGLKALGVKGLNIGTQGVIQGAILDATIHTADEGRMADLFGETNNAFIDWLQTDENDSEAMGKFKNVVDGALFSIGINGVFSAAEPILGRVFRNMKSLKEAVPEAAEPVQQEIAKDMSKLEKIANTSDLVDTVKSIKQEAEETGADASQMVADRLHTADIEDGQNILKTLNDGEDIFVHSDGTWDIKISSWEDAYKTTEEGYRKQLEALDEINGESNVGNTALTHQDQAVRDTWVNRGWIGENEQLTQANANKIIKNYKDKFQLDNNIKVEFVDGLKVKGNTVEGVTSSTTYQGKAKRPTKAAQTKIDKKKLEIQKIQDQITMLEGGNGEISDPLDVLKEKLRIANNELKDLTNIPKPEKLTNITIKIDKAAKNPYATLRAEMEHARDITKGEVPKEEGKHFSRYNGANESEVASGYTYKKSVGRNKALNGETVVEEPKPTVEPAKTETPAAPVETVKPQQLKIDFNSTTEAVDNLATGKAEIKQVSDVDAIVNKAAEIDPEVSGYTWDAIAKDSDKLGDLLVNAEELGLKDTLDEALNIGDVKTMDVITRKVMAVNKLQSHLADKLAALGENPPIEQMTKVVDLIDQIARYTKETGSASGRSLQARKLVNRAVETFGSLRMSELTKAGIHDLADLLEADIVKAFDLKFTRGQSLGDIKRELMTNWLQNSDSPFVQMIMSDKEMATKFDEILDKVLKSNGKVSLEKEILNAVVEADYKAAFNATKLTSDPQIKANVIKNWIDKNGSVTSFYVHNLLSGIGTLAKNIISGGLNTAYFPAKKIIAGYMGGGEALKQEGWNTYKNLMTSWKEAWSLGREAFMNGEGTLATMKDTMALADSETLNGFREWQFDWETPEGIWHGIQNFHSVMTRAMGASDEFMSQLNYRAISRAKALSQADELAKKFNITNEEDINKIADNLFKGAFDKEGRALDVEALAEAKDILYQLPLNGKMFDARSGEMAQVRANHTALSLADNLNQQAAKNFLLKIMFPFVKTGTNILQQNLEHNGLYAVLSKNQRELLMANTREGAMARSQVAFGMFSFMVASGLAMNGQITGSAPANQKERQALFETGWKPYSIKFGNKYVSYQGHEPIQTILGFAADSVNIGSNIVTSNDEAKWEKFTQQVLSTTVNNFLDKAAFRTGLRQLAALTSPDEGNIEAFKKALVQTGQGFLPNASMVKSVSSLGQRDVTAPKSAYERMFNNYFNRGLGDYRRDVFGNRQDNFGLLVTNIATDNSNMPEYAEMERLAEYGFSPTDIRKEIVGTGLKFVNFKDPQTDRSVYDAMQEELSTLDIDGKTLQEAVRELVTSQEYQDLPLGVNMNGVKYSSSEDTKLNAIRDIFVEYNNEAFNKVINEYGDYFVDRKGRTMSEAVEEVQLEKLNQSIQESLNDNLTNQILQYGQ